MAIGGKLLGHKDSKSEESTTVTYGNVSTGQTSSSDSHTSATSSTIIGGSQTIQSSTEVHGSSAQQSSSSGWTAEQQTSSSQSHTDSTTSCKSTGFLHIRSITHFSMFTAGGYSTQVQSSTQSKHGHGLGTALAIGAAGVVAGELLLGRGDRKNESSTSVTTSGSISKDDRKTSTSASETHSSSTYTAGGSQNVRSASSTEVRYGSNTQQSAVESSETRTSASSTIGESKYINGLAGTLLTCSLVGGEKTESSHGFSIGSKTVGGLAATGLAIGGKLLGHKETKGEESTVTYGNVSTDQRTSSSASEYVVGGSQSTQVTETATYGSSISSSSEKHQGATETHSSSTSVTQQVSGQSRIGKRAP